MPQDTSKTIRVAPGREASIHFEQGAFVLLSGSATVFGAPLRPNIKYSFESKGVPICVTGTQHAEIDITGVFQYSTNVASSEIPDLHAKLHARRASCETDEDSGPRVLVVGDVDTGKSSLCRTLINLAVGQRDGGDGSFGVAFTDVDVGQTAVTVPGTIATAFVEGALAVDDEFTNLMPLTFFFGDKSVGGSTKRRYLSVCTCTYECIQSVQAQKPEYRRGGHIVNTMGFTTGLGYELLVQMVEAFQITDIVVTGANEVLLDKLNADVPGVVRHPVAFHTIQRSPNTFVRSRGVRAQARTGQLVSYFTGTKRSPMTPCRITAALRDVFFVNALTFEEMVATEVKALSLAALSHAPHIDAASTSNVAGFVVILEVGRSTVTLLAPAPGPLPRNIFLVSPSISLPPADVPAL